jgi:capsular exopolysaccharide synthesis family protein
MQLDQQNNNLLHYLNILYVRKWIVITFFLIIVSTVTIGNFKATPVYRATAQLIIEKEVSNTKLMSGVFIDDIGMDYYKTQYKIIKSRSLAKKVIDKLRLDKNLEFSDSSDIIDLFLSKIFVEPVRESRLVELSADSFSPELAAKIANTLSEEYIKQNLENRLFTSREILKKLPVDIDDEKKIHNYSIYETLPSVTSNEFIQTLKKRYILLSSEYANLSKKYKDKHPSIMGLKAEIQKLNQSIQKEIKNIVISMKIELSGDMSSNNVRIIDPAEVPQYPIKPRKKINIILACIVGLILGCGGAFFIDSLDNTIKKSQDIENDLKLPFLGIIPRLKQKKERYNMIDDDNPIAVEAIKFVRTSFVFSRPVEELKVVAVTSSMANEGKTFTSLNLAGYLAELDERIVLIDCDLRKCGLTKALKMDNKPGLTDYLIKDFKIDDIIHKTNYKNLYVIPSGPRPPSPGNLLTLDKLSNFFAVISKKFSRVIIDSCPMLPVSDTMNIAKFTDGFVVVAAHLQTDKRMLFETKKKIEHVAGDIVGVILNKTKLGVLHSDQYSYQYKYQYK